MGKKINSVFIQKMTAAKKMRHRFVHGSNGKY